jgi:hypothetical protein
MKTIKNHKLFQRILWGLSGFKNDFIRNKALKKYYSKSNPPPVSNSKVVIWMADERLNMSGLVDRLRGITSVYKLCRKLNIDFKINFTHPFNLSDYLKPNTYNWTISQDLISYNSKQVKPFFYQHKEKISSTIIATFWLKKKYKQLHFYTTMKIADTEYHCLIKELFKPNDELQRLIDYHLKQIGDEFIAVAFRFNGLLEDTTEGKDTQFQKERELSADKKIALINSCIAHLHEIYSENTCKKVLVVSDTPTFLIEAGKLDFVYTPPGEVSQMHFTDNKEVFMKMFLDYYLLTYSKKIFTVVDGDMYISGFHRYAALHNNIPYEIRNY